MLGSLASQQMEHVPNQDPLLLNNQMAMTGSVSTNPVSHGVVKQPQMGPTPLLPIKRKAAVEPLVANKRVVHLDAHVNSPRLSQQSGLSNKKMIRNESMSSKTVSPRVHTSKSKTGPPEKDQNESYEAIRMKMRETLAAALSVDNQDKENVRGEDKSVPQIVGSTAIKPNTAPGLTAGGTEGEKSRYNYIMPDTDASFGDTFFVKDELLQGNGLSWAWDMEVSETREAQTDEKSSSPQELGVRIEAELFKLFGGVNKKYKEKGRSLMFNLKDPNNPELRQKVVSTEISPERLCSMTPEELASKELSEWRMAKAEELDKMIVLPDSEVDMRRLVKKTHKGEYQVEVDQNNDDGVSVDVSVGSSSLTRFRGKTKKDNLSSSLADDEVKDKVVTVSADASDLMQELIVDDVFKDEEGLLPPIVSLDEFMESLDSEPPFKNLPVDDKETKAQLDKDKSESGPRDNGKVSSVATSASHVVVEVDTNNKPNVKTTETSAERKHLPPFSESIGECLWEGDLQLTLSSTVPVIGVFKSGEKTSTKEWPGSMEIKGRVRLEAFEKFLQQLPMSRSRAVMVVHFVLKDSSEYHSATLSEAVDSYVAEERVGFGEPNLGVEVYLCPPHKRITETLSSMLLSKEHIDILKSLENGLIGVVVWRRAHPSLNMLHHKHHRKHLSSRKQENINSNTNFNMTSKSLSFQPLQSDNRDDVVDDDDDDDVPPGFGPGVVVARNEDDLSEFNFSKGSNSPGQTLPVLAQSGLGSRMAPPGPVSHMRRLIHDYGQTGNNINTTSGSTSLNGIRGIENRSWNKDDDDDIPEWQPQLQNNSIQELSRVHLVNQVRQIMGHIVNPVMPVQQPVNIMQDGWVLPPTPRGLPPNATLPGQYYGGNWQQNDPRGGGF